MCCSRVQSCKFHDANGRAVQRAVICQDTCSVPHVPFGRQISHSDHADCDHGDCCIHRNTLFDPELACLTWDLPV